MNATPRRTPRDDRPRADSTRLDRRRAGPILALVLLASACAAPTPQPAPDEDGQAHEANAASNVQTANDTAAASPSPTGAELWVSQNCALCHGADGRSAWWRPGPDLLPNLHEWTAPAMAAYIADPMLAARNLERLDGTGMPGYPHLSVGERLRLAEYVLSLADNNEG